MYKKLQIPRFTNVIFYLRLVFIIQHVLCIIFPVAFNNHFAYRPIFISERDKKSAGANIGYTWTIGHAVITRTKEIA